ncbi:MAG: hypothetical protein KC635_14940, partial [Myxococcales bacterium]|nr:hypothetical protein [Myxococcales bacterium]
CDGDADEGLDTADPPACDAYVCGGLGGCRDTCESDAHCTAGYLCDLFDDDESGRDDECLPSVCGNGAVEIREVCDNGENTGGYGDCLPDCSGYGPSCGDGYVDEGHESCDDGALNGQPNFCDATCSGPTAPECGNGTVEAGEECDLGTGEGGNSNAPDAACRLDCHRQRCGDGVTDVAHGETCDAGNELGATTCGCQPGCRYAPSTTSCRGAAGECDLAETCDGAGVCPADAKRDASFVCREAAGICDLAERCAGGDDCPADELAGADFTCREAAGLCDAVERCSGESVDCPADEKEPAGSVCRGAAGLCDVAETCDGEGDACPEDRLVPPQTPCRDAAGDCDVAELCDGEGAQCPDDVLVPADTVCREAAGDCDVAEVCDGVGAQCPDDVLAASTVVCRDSEGDCDPAELCPGDDADCPEDARSGAEVVCRESRGSCDPEETCDGEGADCPGDELIAPGEACGPELGDCTTGPCTCDAAYECVPSCGNGVVDGVIDVGPQLLAVIPGGLEICDDGAANGQRDACNLTCTGRCDADFGWEIPAGGYGEDTGLGITASEAGDTVAVGAFTGSPRIVVALAPIIPGAAPVPYGGAAFGDDLFFGPGQLDWFVMAQTTDGDARWAACGGGWGDDEARGVGQDQWGATYVAGSFTGDGYAGCCDAPPIVVIGAPSLPDGDCTSLDASGGIEDGAPDVFVTKYDDEGQLLWAASGGAPYAEDFVGGSATDPFGRTVVVGVHGGDAETPATFDDLEITGSGGEGDLFVARVDANGFWDMAQGAGDPATRDMATAVALDGAGNAYVAGYFGGSFTWDGIVVAHSRDATVDGGDALDAELGAPRSAELFVAKLDPDGHVLWVATAHGADADIVPNGIAVDGQGQAHVVGYFHGGSATFGDGLDLAGSDDSPASDVFVAKLTPDGAWAWAKASTRVETPYNQPADNVAWGVDVDRAGGVYVTGQYSGLVAFGGEALLSRSADTSGGMLPRAPLRSPTLPADGIDGFVAKLDRDGAWRWAKSFGGGGQEQGRGLALDPRGNVYLTGGYRGTADFDADQLDPVVSYGDVPQDAPSFDEDHGDDVFVAKMLPDGADQGCFTCGDGTVDPGEACDERDESLPDCEGACDGICSGPANTCGDGWLACGEDVDPGGGSSLDPAMCVAPTGNLWCFEAPGDVFTYLPVEPGAPMTIGPGAKPEEPPTGLGGNSSQHPDCPVCAPTNPNEKCRAGSGRQWGGDGPPLTVGSSARSYCDGDPTTPPCSSLSTPCPHTNDEPAAVECGDYYEFVTSTGDAVVMTFDERTTTQGPTAFSLWVSLSGQEGTFEKVTELATTSFPSQDFGGVATPMHAIDLTDVTTLWGPVRRQRAVHFRLYAWGAVSVDAAWVLDNVRIGAPEAVPR